MKTAKQHMRGLGALYRQPRSSFWWIEYSDHGRRFRESSKSRNRNEAIALLKKRISEVRAGKPHGPEIDKTTLGDLRTMLIDDYKANNRRSTRRAGEAFDHLLEYFNADARAADITTDRVTSYIAHRQTQKVYKLRVTASATINNELAMLRRAFNLALNAEKVARAPTIKMLHLDNARAGFFEAEQFAGVLANLPEYLKPVMRVAYITGWRTTSELLTRQWKHVDLDAGWLRLESGESKTSQPRMFPLTPELREVLLAQRERVSTIEKAGNKIIASVFVHDDGTPIRDFRHAWASACKSAGVAGRLVHDMRRTAVRNLERAGVSRSAAMKLTGHQTEAVYRRYAIVSEGDLQAAAAKLATLHVGDSKKAAKPKVVALHAKP